MMGQTTRRQAAARHRRRTRGMGAAIAKLFRRSTGAAVASNGCEGFLAEDGRAGNRRRGREGHAASGGLLARRAMSGKSSRRPARQLGALHILVNNAGVLGRRGWNRLRRRSTTWSFAVCMRSCFLFSREVIPIMKSRAGGES